MLWANKMGEIQKFSKYERARIIGARGLQISMDAPLLIKMNDDDLEAANFDPLKIAERELEEGVLPISVNRPMPKRKEEDLGKIKIEPIKISDEEKIKAEEEEEKEISEGGEMMGLANIEEEPEAAEAVIEETAEEEEGPE